MFPKPIPPPYDPLEWAKKPFHEKAAMVCNSWAMQGYGTPLGVYLVYALKIAGYIAGWFFFCSFYGGFFLFWKHAGVPLTEMTLPVAAIVAFMCVALPDPRELLSVDDPVPPRDALLRRQLGPSWPFA
jgi:hypothetical protein